MEKLQTNYELNLDISKLDESLNKALKLITDTLTEINTSIYELNQTIGSMNNDFNGMINILAILASTVDIVIAVYKNLNIVLEIMHGVINKLTGPIGIAISVVAGLSLAIGGLVYAVGNQKDELVELTAATKKATEEHIKLREENKKAAESAVEEVDRYGALKNELNNIVDANGKVKKGYEERVGFIVSELSKATDKEIKMTDGLIVNYGSVSKEIDLLIAKKRAKAILDANESSYNDAVKNETNSLKELTDAEKNLVEVQKGKQAFMNDYRKDAETLGMSQKDILESENQAWDNHIKKFTDNVDAKRNKYSEISKTIRANNQATTEFLEGNYEEINKTITGSNEKYAKNYEERQAVLQNNIETEITALKCLNEDKNTMSDEQYNLEKEQRETEIMDNQMKLFAINNAAWENTEAYAEAMAYMSEQGMAAFDENGNLTEAATIKIESIRLKTLEMIPSYTTALQELAESGQVVFDENGSLTYAAQNKLIDTFEAMNEIKPIYATTLRIMAMSGQEVFNTNGELTSAAQRKLIEAYASMNNLIPGYRDSLLAMADEGKAVFDNNGNLTDAAKKKLDDARKGINDKKPIYVNALKETNEDGVKKMKEIKGDEVGEQLITGAGKGATNKKTGFLEILGGIATSALDIFSKFWDINSPSKKAIRLSKSFMEGLTLGITKNKKDFNDSIDDIANTAITKIETSFQGVDTEALVQRMQMAINLENMQMRSNIHSDYTSRLYNAIKSNSSEPPMIKGVLHGNIENHIMIDGRETAIQLAPLISEELAFRSR